MKFLINKILILTLVGMNTGAMFGQESKKITSSAEPEMVFVEGGTFLMGCSGEQGNDCDDDEKPIHRVTVSDFYIGKYEVTQAQWQLIMETGIKEQQEKAIIDGVSYGTLIQGEGENYPIYYVSWEDTQVFIKRLNAATGKNYRLPTEAEWEYAARGGNKSKGYKYAGSNFIDTVAWWERNSGYVAHPVGTRMANELGIYDMSGNVYEWCYDWWSIEYPASEQVDPAGPSSGSFRVSRGGYWYNAANYCRVSNRNNPSPNFRLQTTGFRVACGLKQSSSADSINK
jgi:formylglycine-generating enzyme required for sulfatase activity